MVHRSDLSREATKFNTSYDFARKSPLFQGTNVIEGELEALSGRKLLKSRRKPWHWRDRTLAKLGP
jgi:hypothetical protein